MNPSKRLRVSLATSTLLLVTLLSLQAQPVFAQCRVQPREVQNLDWHPDGEFIAISSNCGVLLMDSGLTQLVDVFPLEDTNVISSIAFNPDGTLLAGSTRRPDIENPYSEVRVWDFATKELARLFPQTFSIIPMAWHPHQNLLIVGTGQISVLNVDSGDTIFTFTSPLTDTTNTTFVVDWAALACWSPQGSYIRAFFNYSAYLITVPQWETTYVGRGIVQGGSCNHAMTRLAITDAAVSDFVRYSDYDRRCDGASVAWRPDEDEGFAVNCDIGTVRVYDRDAELLFELPGDLFRASPLAFSRSIAYSPDGLRLMALGTNGTARLWDTDTYELLARVDIVEMANTYLSQNNAS
jgi:WD40 repeat protein